MRKLIAALAAGFTLTLGTALAAPTAHAAPVEAAAPLPASVQAGHAGGICTEHWFQGWQSNVRGCYILTPSDPAFQYGATDDINPWDGHCAVAQYNANNGNGWINIPNSVSCGPIAPWYFPGCWWCRLVVGNGSDPSQIVTLNNCFTTPKYRC